MTKKTKAQILQDEYASEMGIRTKKELRKKTSSKPIVSVEVIGKCSFDDILWADVTVTKGDVEYKVRTTWCKARRDFCISSMLRKFGIGSGEIHMKVVVIKKIEKANL